MARQIYALFNRREDAAAALEEIRSGGCESGRCSVVLHDEELDMGKVALDERAGKELAPRGAVLTGAIGAVAVGIAATAVGAVPLAAAAAAGGVAALYGMLAGGISASDDPDRLLRAIEEEVEKGKILVALDTEDAEQQAMAEEVFEKHGGYQIVA
jgi:hypothetical protein